MFVGLFRNPRMDSLREITKQEHRRAERTAFMSRMIKKKISPYEYYVYLKNQLFSYTNLEYYATEAGAITKNMEPILRGAALFNDVITMETEQKFSDAPIFSASHHYVNYIRQIKDDKDKLLAHVYVRHMGDLSGGQIIKKLVPGPTALYEFDGDPVVLKDIIRSKLHNNLAEEAKVCFSMVQKFLEELEDYFSELDINGQTV